jgi:hypothetical protein
MDLRYPIGKFEWAGSSNDEQRQHWIEEIANLPAGLLMAVGGLTQQQLGAPYRDGGWTVRQLVHHVADSHMNSYVRCKLALTEDEPTIKPYDEKLWAETPDSLAAPCEVSLSLIDSLHRRWVVLWKNITSEQWSRKYMHPERGATSLEWTLALYAWHGRHHTAHVTELRKRMNWI